MNIHNNNCDNEKKLMQLSSEGDTLAFARLFHLYKHKLYGFLLKLTGSPQTTEDIIQDIFTKIWMQREKLTTIDRFGSYLFRMAQNHAINAFRKIATEATILSKLEIVLENNSTEEYLNKKEAHALFNEAFSRLTTQQKLVYKLSRDEGLKYDEIADRLNISCSTVKNHMIIALRILRETFSRPDMARVLVLIFSFSVFLKKYFL